MNGSIPFISEKDGKPSGIWQASTEESLLHFFCSAIQPYNDKYIIVGQIDGASLGYAYGMNSPKHNDILGKKVIGGVAREVVTCSRANLVDLTTT